MGEDSESSEANPELSPFELRGKRSEPEEEGCPSRQPK